MGQLKMTEVRKTYGTMEVIKGVSLDIAHGEFVVFVGPSGCGKSTLLRMIAGLEEISGGEVAIDGTRVNDLPPVKRGISMVFQSYALYPHMSVYENIAFPLRVSKMPKAELDARVRRASSILKLDERLRHKPGQLSGGQRQRVAIGRSIVRDPQVFLFDEPLSNLDAALRAEMRVELSKLHGELDATMIYVTHDQVEAMTMADRIVVLDGGRISQVGSPLELYHKPANVFVAGFIGNPKMNFLPVTCLGADATGVTVELPGAGRLTLPVSPRDGIAGQALTLGIRPEHLSAEGGDLRLSLMPKVIERLGMQTVAYATHGEEETAFNAILPGSAPARAGTPLSLGLSAADCHLFDAEGQAFERHVALSALDPALMMAASEAG
ncbi:sn-glycerol-3-phosphate ABC transporter ATP-binding protein UgpC [Pseudooceanicola sp. CBS1P-1]|uniref:sn-glycerol-3-phosphate ABC transporter ATP-binding protein UgpC n=1 Tax=Pseudooceanicola albus TaxID=2692189 RepID=A0A6L7G488_9RHOB|nr:MULTISPECIES: sn-glycerol-3-phosphate ABC transporter ATP-binding protein UgpC [Pseudooceanicola]MBT9385206.1 sn-glycerol-3-phosphate ABC transporter ATP-binding protein UgpC [Pseudooceanicola endophyticus]MXN18502.1 sn-glycerol-3-phosphate ABC transporter ATP-binding protein UgpC [Pseudooceanicola albus]